MSSSAADRPGDRLAVTDLAITGPHRPRTARELAMAAAFFDVDNTVIRGSTMYCMARGMISRGVFPPRQIANLVYRQARFVLTNAEKATDMTTIVTEAQRLVAGRRVSQVREFGERVFEQSMVPRIWPEIAELIVGHRDAGREVWLVTSTGQEIADMIAEHVGATGALGTRSETADGRYTGRLAGPVMHGRAKADAVRDLAAATDIDLTASFAYSDSANDIPLLSLVGHPVAVNSDSKLRSHATAAGWDVLDCRHPSRAGRALVTLRTARHRVGL